MKSFAYIAIIITVGIFSPGNAYADRNDDWNAWADTCMKYMGSGDSFIRNGAIDALVKLGPDIVPYMLNHVKAEDSETIGRVKEVITRLGKPGNEKLRETADNNAAPAEVIAALNEFTANTKVFDSELVIKTLEPEFDEDGNEKYKDPGKIAKKLISFGSAAGPVLVDYWKNKRRPDDDDARNYYYRYNEDMAIQQALMKIGNENLAPDLQKIALTNSYAIAPLYKIQGQKAVPALLDIYKNYYSKKEKESDYNISEVNAVLKDAKPAEAVPVLKEIIVKDECTDIFAVAEILVEISGTECIPALKDAMARMQKKLESQPENNIVALINMNKLIAGMGDKDGVAGLISLLESEVLADNNWQLAELVNTIRKITTKDLTLNLRPFKENRIEIMQAYSKWWNENKSNAQWDEEKKRFTVKD
ncbi:MAG: hypothetical protein HZA48_04175 [Planctomycetes bacterium]|nr:hypothetical protein [Planctomycetota bacterium]